MYDRGQILIDLAVAQILGGEAISDFQGMRHLAPVIGPVPSNPTVWRALSEAGELRLARVNTSVAAFRRHWWALLAPRRGDSCGSRSPGGSPWSTWTPPSCSPPRTRRTRPAHYKGGVGFCPNLATL